MPRKRSRQRKQPPLRGTRKTGIVLMQHAITRARERYDKRLTLSDIANMNDRIQRGQGTFIERQSTTRTVWALVYQGTWYAAVYNKQLGSIATFLARWKLDQWEEWGFLKRE